MVCAPSNAAIDEIISRILKEGIFNENGEMIHPNIIRVGPLNNDAPEEIKKVSMNFVANEIFKTKVVGEN